MLSGSRPCRASASWSNLDTDDLQRSAASSRKTSTVAATKSSPASVSKAQRRHQGIAEQENYDLIIQDAVTVNPRIDITDKVIQSLASTRSRSMPVFCWTWLARRLRELPERAPTPGSRLAYRPRAGGRKLPALPRIRASAPCRRAGPDELGSSQSPLSGAVGRRRGGGHRCRPRPSSCCSPEGGARGRPGLVCESQLPCSTPRAALRSGSTRPASRPRPPEVHPTAVVAARRGAGRGRARRSALRGRGGARIGRGTVLGPGCVVGRDSDAGTGLPARPRHDLSRRDDAARGPSCTAGRCPAPTASASRPTLRWARAPGARFRNWAG